jgi:spermidine synthase
MTVVRRTAIAVGLIAAAMLMLELLLTRLYSVLFGYHYSFFAVSLVMTGLALGGLLVSRWRISELTDEQVQRRLALLALGGAIGSVLALGYLVLAGDVEPFWAPRLDESDVVADVWVVARIAAAPIPALVATGAFLAVAFARHSARIGLIYAVDLLCAAAACVLSIVVMRTIEGPASLFVPAALAALAALVIGGPALGRALRLLTIAALAVACAGAIAGAMHDGNLLDLATAGNKDIVLERWNEHSRIMLHRRRGKYYITIDHGAGTYMYRTDKRAAGAPIPIKPWWDRSVRYVAHQLRPLQRTAVIGVGGGTDLLAPLKNGAKKVDGYEINGLLIELLDKTMAHWNGIASWPEVELHHSEGRVGIAHAGVRYDLIQASMVDTWAATAAGGMVLSENALYTVEGWRTFLRALADGGMLTMTRWHIPSAPAETQRVVSLAAAALAKEGVADARGHVLLVTAKRVATVIVSKRKFNATELARLRRIAAAGRMTVLLGTTASDTIHAPSGAAGQPDHTLARLLDPATRAQTIAKSPYDITPPTDRRPYFFLQMRATDIASLFRGERSKLVEQITFKAIRTLVLLSGGALGLALLVLLLGLVTLPGPRDAGRGGDAARAPPEQRQIRSASHPPTRTYRWMMLYFFAIGCGYVLIQLGLHQSFMLLLGRPTLALSVVLLSMLLGTGLGSALSQRLLPDGRMWRGWALIVVVLGLLVIGVDAIAALEGIASEAGRIIISSLIFLIVGAALGLAFPLGVRLISPTGDWAVQKAWAVNGAASIAGAAGAAILGVTLGSRALLVCGLGCYVAVLLLGLHVSRAQSMRNTP